MNDDFLHRIRVEPPPGYLARLKKSLDRQPPLPREHLHPRFLPRRRSVFRALAFGLLFGTSAFAITLLTVDGARQSARQFLSRIEDTIGLGHGSADGQSNPRGQRSDGETEENNSSGNGGFRWPRTLMGNN